MNVLNNNKINDILNLVKNEGDRERIGDKVLLDSLVKELDNNYGLYYNKTNLDNNINYDLELVDDKIINKENKDCLVHKLFMGDNGVILDKLLLEYKNKVNIIYIDPPYNTQSSKLGYKDKFTQNEWLSFMGDRLEKAKLLLSDDGIIFISIDDNEYAHLKLLCDSIFGEDNYINTVVWKKGGGKSSSKYLANQKEYCLIYKSEKDIEFKKKKSPSENYKLIDENGRHYCLRGFDMQGLIYAKSLDYPIEAPDGTFIYPGKSYEKYMERMSGNYNNRDWCWTLSKEEFKNRLDNNLIVFKKQKTGWRVYYKSYYEDKFTSYSDVWEKCETRRGVQEIKNIFKDRVFQFSKPVDYIKFLINLYDNNANNLLVLDFFAGSGTTGQACLELNREDGGKREFILVTNNENNICEEVTYNRLKTIITGRRSDNSVYGEPFQDKLEFYKNNSSEV